VLRSSQNIGIYICIYIGIYATCLYVIVYKNSYIYKYSHEIKTKGKKKEMLLHSHRSSSSSSADLPFGAHTKIKKRCCIKKVHILPSLSLLLLLLLLLLHGLIHVVHKYACTHTRRSCLLLQSEKKWSGVVVLVVVVVEVECTHNNLDQETRTASGSYPFLLS
jgi:hypothetical protein